MKEIQLTKGYVALVDDEDFERVNQFKWSAAIQKRTVYARRGVWMYARKIATHYLHRFILGISDSNVKVDHKDHNGLNCQRTNLRVCTIHQNMGNMQKSTKGSSQFKGVTWDKWANKWKAQIYRDGKSKHLGSFVNQRDAAAAYDAAATQYFGEFAYVNFKESQ